MATYCISDIHGEYNLFIALLNKINFSESDTLYVLGDIIDKGEQSIKLLDFIMQYENIHCIMGNHEHMFLSFYRKTMEGFEQEFNEISCLHKLQLYFPYSNIRLTWDMIDYIENLPYYIELDNYILVHAGVEVLDDKILPMEYQDIEYLIYDRSFKDIKVPEDFNKTFIIGHTPCNYDNNTGHFIKSENKIRIDTGVSFTRMLGVLRLDDMQEFYI